MRFLNTTIVGDNQQLDHILYRKSDAKVIESGTFGIPSDNMGIFATIEL
jgi:hypothetical protein